MQFKVQLFLDGNLIDPSETASLKINNATVQRIVNRVARRCAEAQAESRYINAGEIENALTPMDAGTEEKEAV